MQPSIDVLLFSAAILLLLGVLASKASGKVGIPSLVLFLLIGMLAGSEGPGGIPFDDPWLTQLLGVITLALILFSGGIRFSVAADASGSLARSEFSNRGYPYHRAPGWSLLSLAARLLAGRRPLARRDCLLDRCGCCFYRVVREAGQAQGGVGGLVGTGIGHERPDGGLFNCGDVRCAAGAAYFAA